MSVTTRLTLAAAALLGLGAAGAANAGGSPLGVWLDDTGRGAVEIVECGQGKLCGKLVWLQDAKKSKACGTAIIGDVGKIDGAWDGGWIYSPEKDSKYDVELTPSGSDKLTVLGYAGTKLFSKEMTWTRAPADLKRCDQPQIEAKAAPVPAQPKVATAPMPPPKSGGAQTASIVPPAAVAAAPPAPKTAAQEKTDAEKWASVPSGQNVKTAQADVAPEASDKPAAKPRAKTVSRKKKTCRVDAPFVRVEFPCDDD